MTTESSTSTVSESVSSLDVVLALYEAIDTGQATKAIELFTDDAAFDHPERMFRGTEEIHGFLSRRESDASRRTVHVLNNTRLGEVTGGECDISSVVFIYAPDAEDQWHLHRVVRMRHIVRSVDGQWRISARAIEPLERSAGDHPG